MSSELPDSAVSPPTGAGESTSGPSRRTVIATGVAVGGVVVAGGTFLAGAEEATGTEAAPSSRVSLTVNGTRRTAVPSSRVV
jgi:xanthine dehydrogenase YagT iron-sulfur-binding subunit